MEFQWTEKMDDVSSAFASAYHNRHNEELLIEFNHGAEIVYSDFTLNDWNAFKDSLSKGMYYNGRIKGNFLGRKVEITKLHWFSDDVASKFSDTNFNTADNKPVINVTVNVYVSGENVEASAAALQELFEKNLRRVQNSSFSL